MFKKENETLDLTDVAYILDTPSSVAGSIEEADNSVVVKVGRELAQDAAQTDGEKHE